MTAPNGYAYSLGGRALLTCMDCGALIGFDYVDVHNAFHAELRGTL